MYFRADNTEVITQAEYFINTCVTAARRQPLQSRKYSRIGAVPWWRFLFVCQRWDVGYVCHLICYRYNQDKSNCVWIKRRITYQMLFRDVWPLILGGTATSCGSSMMPQMPRDTIYMPFKAQADLCLSMPRNPQSFSVRSRQNYSMELPLWH